MSAIKFVSITIIILLSCNVLGFIISLLTIHVKSLHKYRIQDKKINPSIFYNRLPLILFNISLLSIISAFGLYFLFPIKWNLYANNSKVFIYSILIYLTFTLISLLFISPPKRLMDGTS